MKKHSALLRIVIIMAICGVLGILFCHIRQSGTPSSRSAIEKNEEQQTVSANIFRKATPSLAEVTVPGRTGLSGTGFFIRPDYLVTQHQVLADGEIIPVTVNGRQYMAKFAGADPATDLAVLRIPGEKFPFLQFSSRQFLRPGVKCFAVMPDRIEEGVIFGIRGDNLLLDTAIFADDTGNPLLNLRGEILGMHLTPHKDEVLSGDVVQTVTEELIRQGFVERPMLGILAKNTADGVVVLAVARRSPAADSLDPGDLIQKVNDKNIKSAKELRQIILNTGAGKEILLEIRRKDRILSGGLILQKSTGNWFRDLGRKDEIQTAL